jgi:hypothetical protein
LFEVIVIAVIVKCAVPKTVRGTCQKVQHWKLAVRKLVWTVGLSTDQRRKSTKFRIEIGNTAERRLLKIE